MFRPLPFVSVRKQQPNPRRQIPFVFARADELIDDYLRAVRKITELRFPQNQRLREIAAESVFKTQTARFRKGRIMNLAKRFARRRLRDGSEGDVLPLI